MLALLQVGNAAGELDDLQAAGHFTHGIGEHLAMLTGDQPRQLVGVILDQGLELEQDTRALERRDPGSGGEGVIGDAHRLAGLGDDERHRPERPDEVPREDEEPVPEDRDGRDPSARPRDDEEHVPGEQLSARDDDEDQPERERHAPARAAGSRPPAPESALRSRGR